MQAQFVDDCRFVPPSTARSSAQQVHLILGRAQANMTRLHLYGCVTSCFCSHGQERLRVDGCNLFRLCAVGGTGVGAIAACPTPSELKTRHLRSYCASGQGGATWRGHPSDWRVVVEQPAGLCSEPQQVGQHPPWPTGVHPTAPASRPVFPARVLALPRW